MTHRRPRTAGPTTLMTVAVLNAAQAAAAAVCAAESSRPPRLHPTGTGFIAHDVFSRPAAKLIKRCHNLNIYLFSPNLFVKIPLQVE